MAFHHDFPLPNVMLYMKECNNNAELGEKMYNKYCENLRQGSTPIPSSGEARESKEFDIEDFENEILNNYRNKLLRATSIFLSPKWKTQKPLERFRSVAKAVLLANRWKITTLLKQHDSMEEVNKTDGDVKKDHLHFNVEAFKVTTSGSTIITKKMKYVLLKDPSIRTPEEIDSLFTLTNQMKCFSRYSPTVRRELAALMCYETYEDGRILIQEGTIGMSMYYIASGSVHVEVSQVDLRTGEKSNNVVHEIPSGSSFGELALVQECIRTASIVCKGLSQFLRIDREDFDLAIKRSYEKEWLDKLHMVKSIPYFSGWSGKDLRHIILNCFIQDYSPNTLIIGNVIGMTDNIYFVFSGTCDIVRQVCVNSYLQSKGRTRISLPNSNEVVKCNRSNSSNDQKHLKTRFLSIGQLVPGDYFGVGESLQYYYILASTRVECLVVPRHAVVALERLMNKSGNVFEKKCNLMDMQRRAQLRLLSRNEVFEKWMTNLRWKNYKKKVMKQALTRKLDLDKKRETIPFRFKDFQLPSKLPTEANFTPTFFAEFYPIARKGGFSNIQNDKPRPPPLVKYPFIFKSRRKSSDLSSNAQSIPVPEPPRRLSTKTLKFANIN